MTKEEFERKIKEENPYIGVNKIRLNKFVPASFILGCYYNEQSKNGIYMRQMKEVMKHQYLKPTMKKKHMTDCMTWL